MSETITSTSCMHLSSTYTAISPETMISTMLSFNWGEVEKCIVVFSLVLQKYKNNDGILQCTHNCKLGPTYSYISVEKQCTSGDGHDN